MSNLHAPGSSKEVALSQKAEESFAEAVHQHPALIKLSINLRYIPARDHAARAIERNHSADRQERKLTRLTSACSGGSAGSSPSSLSKALDRKESKVPVSPNSSGSLRSDKI